MAIVFYYFSKLIKKCLKLFSNSVTYNCPQGRKEEMNMIKSTTFEEIFKTIEENNNLFEMGIGQHQYTLIVYVDDYDRFEGSSMKEFIDWLNETYIGSFAKRIVDSLITGTTYDFYFTDISGKVEHHKFDLWFN